jgi:hypothetical protein
MYLPSVLLGMFLGGTYNHFQVQKQFKGILPNDHLVKKFGSRNDEEIIASFEKEHKNLSKNQEVSTKPKYPMIYLNPSYSFVVENLDNDDISHILIFGGITLVVCYGVFGKLCYFIVFSLLKDCITIAVVPKVLRVNKESPHMGFYALASITAMILHAGDQFQYSEKRLLGIRENEREVQRYGKLNEVRLVEEIFQLKYPEVNFQSLRKIEGNDGFNWEDVLLKEEVVDLIERALKTRYPMIDLTEINYQKMKTHSGKANAQLKKILREKGHETDLLI